MKKLIVLFIASCTPISEDAKEDKIVIKSIQAMDSDCKKSDELKITNDRVCMETEVCKTGDIRTTSSYFCMCDLTCLCFFTKLTASNDLCTPLKIEDCNYKKSYMYILGSDFCSMPLDKRNKIFEQFKNVMPEDS